MRPDEHDRVANAFRRVLIAFEYFLDPDADTWDADAFRRTVAECNIRASGAEPTRQQSEAWLARLQGRLGNPIKPE